MTRPDGADAFYHAYDIPPGHTVTGRLYNPQPEDQTFRDFQEELIADIALGLGLPVAQLKEPVWVGADFGELEARVIAHQMPQGGLRLGEQQVFLAGHRVGKTWFTHDILRKEDEKRKVAMSARQRELLTAILTAYPR